MVFIPCLDQLNRRKLHLKLMYLKKIDHRFIRTSFISCKSKQIEFHVHFINSELKIQPLLLWLDRYCDILVSERFGKKINIYYKIEGRVFISHIRSSSLFNKIPFLVLSFTLHPPSILLAFHSYV